MRKKIGVMITAMALIAAMSATIFADSGTWKFTGTTWKCIAASGGILHDTFTDDGYWVNHDGDWVESTVPRDVAAEKSANGKRLIAISKSGHVVELWQNGELVKSYKCSTGMADGDKERQGDCKTPVGEFYVCLMNTNSAYTRGIGVSYPMIEDADRGLQQGLITQSQRNAIVSAIQQGKCPNWNTALGGTIEIHGTDTVVGTNASHGCIVVSNADILDLFSRVSYGDTILIYE